MLKYSSADFVSAEFARSGSRKIWPRITSPPFFNAAAKLASWSVELSSSFTCFKTFGEIEGPRFFCNCSSACGPELLSGVGNVKSKAITRAPPAFSRCTKVA